MKAAHIMLRAADSDSPEKAAATEQRIREIYGQVTAGTTTFADAALKYSEDEGSSGKGGELPEFTTGKMIEEFEDQAFALKNDGDISQPFKTRFGWHIVKRLSYTPPPTYDQAKGDLKSKISRDSRADITKKVFLDKLKKEYHYTPQPKNMKSVYALVDSTIFKKGNTVTDTLLRKDAVEGKVMHNGMAFDREINGTIKQGKVVNIRSKKHDEIATSPEDTVVVRDVQQGWRYDRAKAAKLTKPVFTIDGRAYSQTEFLDYLESKQKREQPRDFHAYVDSRYAEFVDDMMLAYEDGNLEKKYPEFRMLMKEYRDGILLFELTDQKVWSKAVKDTAGLQTYYDAHKADFQWLTRWDCDIYTCANASVAKQVRTLYAKGKRGKDMTDAVNKTSALDLSIDGGTYSAEDKPFLAGLTKEGLSSDIAGEGGKVMIVDVRKVLPPTAKTLDESRGLVTAAYQDALEKEWIAELRGKYPVVTNKDVLYSIH
jgi:peptidyl-prolyl cis-trans isomerase SurA